MAGLAAVLGCEVSEIEAQFFGFLMVHEVCDRAMIGVRFDGEATDRTCTKVPSQNGGGRRNPAKMAMPVSEQNNRRCLATKGPSGGFGEICIAGLSCDRLQTRARFRAMVERGV